MKALECWARLYWIWFNQFDGFFDDISVPFSSLRAVDFSFLTFLLLLLNWRPLQIETAKFSLKSSWKKQDIHPLCANRLIQARDKLLFYFFLSSCDWTTSPTWTGWNLIKRESWHLSRRKVDGCDVNVWNLEKICSDAMCENSVIWHWNKLVLCGEKVETTFQNNFHMKKLG